MDHKNHDNNDDDDDDRRGIDHVPTATSLRVRSLGIVHTPPVSDRRMNNRFSFGSSSSTALRTRHWGAAVRPANKHGRSIFPVWVYFLPLAFVAMLLLAFWYFYALILDDTNVSGSGALRTVGDTDMSAAGLYTPASHLSAVPAFGSLRYDAGSLGGLSGGLSGTREDTQAPLFAGVLSPHIAEALGKLRKRINVPDPSERHRLDRSQSTITSSSSLHSTQKRVRRTVPMDVLVAGLPRFPRVFARDSIISALLLLGSGELGGVAHGVVDKRYLNRPGDKHNKVGLAMLRSALLVCKALQGRAIHTHTGEEPGKVFHEWPGFPQDGRLTTYSASDTTGLFVLGASVYYQISGDAAFVNSLRPSIDAALNYIARHVNSDMYLWYEDPIKFIKADRYALKVTYWMQSDACSRRDGVLAYPASSSLVQALYIAALRSAVHLPARTGHASVSSASQLSAGACQRLARTMLRALKKNFLRGASSREAFVIGKDSLGILKGVSSGALQLLWFLGTDDLRPDEKSRIEASATRTLATDVGFRRIHSNPFTSRLQFRNNARDHVVWPFEQAIIHQAANRFDMRSVASISSRAAVAMSFFGEDRGRASGDSPPSLYSEFFEPIPGATATSDEHFSKKWRAGGCELQLLSVASWHYFETQGLVGTVSVSGDTRTVADAEATPLSARKQADPAQNGERHPRARMQPHRFCQKFPHLFRGVALDRRSAYCGDEILSSGANTERALRPALSSRVILRRAQNNEFLVRSAAPSPVSSSVPSGLTFTCLHDDSRTIPLEFVNDDFCDCDDGTDEPGTAACAALSSLTDLEFRCSSGEFVKNTMVDDGVCDCRDGSDEYRTDVCQSFLQRLWNGKGIRT